MISSRGETVGLALKDQKYVYYGLGYARKEVVSTTCCPAMSEINGTVEGGVKSALSQEGVLYK